MHDLVCQPDILVGTAVVLNIAVDPAVVSSVRTVAVHGAVAMAPADWGELCIAVEPLLVPGFGVPGL